MKVILTKEAEIFVLSLDEDHNSRSQKYIRLLTDFGSLIRMPYSKNILPGIFELRVGGKQNIRLIYTFFNDSAIIFYGFMKKTEAIELHEMNAIKIRFNNLHV